MGWLGRLLGKDGKATTEVATTPAASTSTSPAKPRAGEDVELRAGSPEFDLFVAKGTLDLGEKLPHGASHLAELLMVDPAQREWRALVARYIEAADPDIDALVPDVDPRHASTEALRAYLWHAQGRANDAVARLLDVTRALHDTRYLDAWALEWLEAPGTMDAVPEQTALMLFSLKLTLTNEYPSLTARAAATVQRWSDLMERAAPRYGAGSMLTLMRAGLKRKAGLFDEALAIAGPIERAQDFNAAVAVGMALRRKGDYAASAAAFERASTLDPANVNGPLEVGDSWLLVPDWPRALDAYERALRIAPEHPWAEPSAWYCHWHIDGDDEWTKRIAQKRTPRGLALLFRAFGAIAPSADAGAGVLRQMRQGLLERPATTAPAKPGNVKLALSTIEAPSVRLAFALEFEAFAQPVTLKVEVAHIPTTRDPRQPVQPVDHLLWRYDGTDPRPALAPPSPDVLARIADLARQHYDPNDNWAEASHVAAALGPTGVRDVLATMVHPPALPSGAKALDWLPRVQQAAAMVVAQVDDGWDGSARRAALTSLLFGPDDWTTVAAIRVLARIARNEKALAQDVDRLFALRERFLPSEGHWDWVQALYDEWQTLPWLFDPEREALAAKAKQARGDTQASA